MKNLLTFIFATLFSLTAMSQYSTCASAASGTSLADGACLTNQGFPGSVNMSGTCIGGNNPVVYIPFVAGSCSQFTINPDFSLNPTGSSFGYTVLTTGCSNALVITECVGNIVQDQDFTISGISYNGGAQLVPGTKYVLRLYGAVPAGGTMDICYNANTQEEPSNECGGALGLGTTTTTYFNGGDCSFNGTYDDTPSNPSLDGAASLYCAGSLENTQWVTFSPVAGSTSFQIIGTNINCTAGACAYQFAIFSGSCGSLVNEGCVSNGNPCANGPDPNTAISQAGGNVLTWSGVTDVGFTATISPSSGTFNGTEVFYLAMDGNSDAQCYYTLQGINVQPLPIELVDFDGRFINDNKPYIDINWYTASEINNDYFMLEKSYDGYEWNVYHKENGSGNSSTLNHYNHRDYDVKNGIVYYRLSQTDFDGRREYFKIIAVSTNMHKPTLVNRFTTMGTEIIDYDNYRGFVIELYDDNSTKKVMKIN